MSFYEYHVLSMLSETEQRTLSVSRLAELTSSSVTRLSSVAKRLEARGLLARITDPADRRVTLATLTDAGLAGVTAAAPRHVTIVRRLIVDASTPAQLRQLQAIQQRILASWIRAPSPARSGWIPSPTAVAARRSVPLTKPIGFPELVQSLTVPAFRPYSAGVWL